MAKAAAAETEAPESDETVTATVEQTNNTHDGCSILIDGKDYRFKNDQMELPGMPAVSRLRQLAEAHLDVGLRVEEEKAKQLGVAQQILLELKEEGRDTFAFRKDGRTVVFQITSGEEKLKVKKGR